MATAGYNTTVLATSQPSVSFTNEGMTDSGDLTTFTITNQAKRYLDPTVAVVVQAQYDETQLLTITGSPTGGTFVLRFGGQNTSTIAYNAAASAVQTALQALSSIGSGNALVTGSAGGPWTVEFAGSLAKASQALITLQTNSLTGGTSPSVGITEVKAGASWATISSGFTLYRVNARVTFTSAQPAGTQVRLASGNYFPVIAIANAKSCQYAGKLQLEDATVFNTAGTRSYIPTLASGVLTMDTFWINIARVSSLQNRDLLVVGFTLATGNKYEGYCYTSESNLKVDVAKLLEEGLSFQLTDEFYRA